MGVDQRVYAAATRSFLHGLQQGIRIGRKPTVDHQRAIFTMHGDDIAAGALEEEKTAEIGD
jgi:hypothetical protein